MTTNYQQQSESYLGNAGGAAASMLGLATTQKTIANRSPSEQAGLAAVDSNNSFDEALGIQNRNASRMGINPNSGRFGGLQQRWALARAAAEAGARTRGRINAENTQFTRLGQAANTFGSASTANRAVANEYGDIASQYGAMQGYGSGARYTAGGSKKGTNAVKTIGGSAQTVIGEADASLGKGDGASGIENIDGLANLMANSVSGSGSEAESGSGSEGNGLVQDSAGTYYGSQEALDSGLEDGDVWTNPIDETGMTADSMDLNIVDEIFNDDSGSSAGIGLEI